MESVRKCFSLSRGRVSAYPPILQRNFLPQHPFIIYIVRITFFFLWIVSFFGNNCVFVFFSMYFFPIVFSAQIYFPRRAHFEGQSTWLQWSWPSPTWCHQWLWWQWWPAGDCQWVNPSQKLSMEPAISSSWLALAMTSAFLFINLKTWRTWIWWELFSLHYTWSCVLFVHSGTIC